MEVERNRQLYVTLDQKITALVLGGYPDEFGHSIRRNLAGYSD
jgi:hypothetical protein